MIRSVQAGESMFWLHEEDLPDSIGNELFCAVHLVYIAVFLALFFAYIFLYRKLDEDRRARADRILGSAVFFFGLCEYGITALIGHFTIYTLPLHVCSLMFLLTVLHAWTNRARSGSFGAKLHGFLSAVLFHPGILGSLAALLFPDWLNYPFWNYLSISGFLLHGFLLVYGASLLVKIAEAPDPKTLLLHDLRDSILFLSAGAIAILLFDRVTGANYWFMAGPGSDSPFTGLYLHSGYGVYLLAYLLTALFITGLWYVLRRCLLFRARKDL